MDRTPADFGQRKQAAEMRLRELDRQRIALVTRAEAIERRALEPDHRSTQSVIRNCVYGQVLNAGSRTGQNASYVFWSNEVPAGLQCDLGRSLTGRRSRLAVEPNHRAPAWMARRGFAVVVDRDRFSKASAESQIGAILHEASHYLTGPILEPVETAELTLGPSGHQQIVHRAAQASSQASHAVATQAEPWQQHSATSSVPVVIWFTAPASYSMGCVLNTPTVRLRIIAGR